MARRMPGQVMKDRIVGRADVTPEIRVRRTAPPVGKLLGMPEKAVGVNHLMMVWGDRPR